MTKREEIATAIEKALLSCDAMKRAGPSAWTIGPCFLAADAVLDALMEPDENMVAAAWVARSSIDAAPTPGETFAMIWRAMLAAAKEG